MTQELNLIGKEVQYKSRSGKGYKAVITNIPVNPWHGEKVSLPTVSLEFRDERGKLVRKERVLPRYQNDGSPMSYRSNECTYWPFNKEDINQKETICQQVLRGTVK